MRWVEDELEEEDELDELLVDCGACPNKEVEEGGRANDVFEVALVPDEKRPQAVLRTACRRSPTR